MELGIGLLAVCMYAVYTWVIHGRDAKGKGVVVTSYEPPTGFSPAEVGVLADYRAEDREISATILDLAIRGYIAIKRFPEDTSQKQEGYSFTLLRDDVLDLKPHEKTLLNGMFGVVGASFAQKVQASITNPEAKKKAMLQYPANSKKLIGTTVTTADIKPYFGVYVAKAKADVLHYLTFIGMFKKNPLQAGADFYILAIACFAGILFVSDSTKILLIITAVVLFFSGVVMSARSRRGQRAKEVIEGFRVFLNTVEKERYHSLQRPEVVQTGSDGVALFEKYLPYAIALGVEDSWTSQFKNAYTTDIVIAGRLELGINDVASFASTVYGILFISAKE